MDNLDTGKHWTQTTERRQTKPKTKTTQHKKLKRCATRTH